MIRSRVSSVSGQEVFDQHISGGNGQDSPYRVRFLIMDGRIAISACSHEGSTLDTHSCGEPANATGAPQRTHPKLLWGVANAVYRLRELARGVTMGVATRGSSCVFQAVYIDDALLLRSQEILTALSGEIKLI